MIIIGITGTLGAGKGTIVDYLVQNKGFVHYSVRAYITEECQRRGLEVNRDTLTQVGNDLRAAHCPSYITDQLFERATCDRGRSGCVIVKDKQILVTGYVGSPRGLPHCDDVGHLFKKMIHEDGTVTQHCVRTVHAEQNAICQAARRGIALDGSTLYCRMTPCRTCAMLIINCGIVRVVCERRYHAGAETEEMFRQVGIELVYKYDEVVQYAGQRCES